MVTTVKNSHIWSKADIVIYWVSKHYLALVNLLILTYLGFAFLAPVMMKTGWNRPANIIYHLYSVVCHQLAFRSFFIFGEQVIYPRSEANIGGLLSFQEATGHVQGSQLINLWFAHEFTGDPILGYKVALCERDVAIYGSLLIFGLIFSFFRSKIKPLPWYWWVTIGLIPIGLDGISQLISQPPFGIIPFRESTSLLRVLTGSLFGMMTAWFGYPLLEETMADSNRILVAKQQIAKANELEKTG